MKTSARAGIFLTVGYPLISLPGDAWGSAESNPADLAVVSGDTEKAVLKAIDLLGGIKRFVKKGQRVMIKPNMSFAKTPAEAANTSPRAVA
ncbi:MAG: hypothetical protein KAQ81_03255, partial [Deltaproteobacteria bacterium]|nr:hypothetical protein [Deltaproteobacteria bacterium]